MTDDFILSICVVITGLSLLLVILTIRDNSRRGR